MRYLLIEDDRELADSMCFQIEKECGAVDVCCSGADAEYYLAQNIYDAILLDRMLPGVDGLTLLKKLRAGGCKTPVIFVTAMDAVGDRVTGLDAGADDYLVKPFSMPELLARLRAVSRRPPNLAADETLFACGDLALDSLSLILKGPDGEVTLSKTETQLLAYLMEKANKAITRAQIFGRVWGPDTLVENGNLDNYIHFLRRRLKAIGSCTGIKTVYGVGYRLETNS
ncbi:MAG: response regulator transcription factor [Oscillospiraceae bacterium]|nr:response regulator transcription factor [Oscillospiraceae bacterium]